jgi:iron complex outermembrane receptor protein
MRELLSYKPGSSQILGLSEVTDDPGGHGVLRSSMNLGRNVTFDLALRYIASLPQPALAAYTEMDARVAWQVNKYLEVGLIGSNLLHPRHLEFAPPNGEEITRSVLAEALWRY